MAPDAHDEIAPKWAEVAIGWLGMGDGGRRGLSGSRGLIGNLISGGGLMGRAEAGWRGFREIYDALADAVDGEMLDELYVEFRRELEIKEQGGAVARVGSVEFTEIRPEQASANADGYPVFDCLCRWHAAGTVEHWGHVHTRENAYEAVFKITGTDDGWRLVEYEIRDTKLVRSETGLRL